MRKQTYHQIAEEEDRRRRWIIWECRWKSEERLAEQKKLFDELWQSVRPLLREWRAMKKADPDLYARVQMEIRADEAVAAVDPMIRD